MTMKSLTFILFFSISLNILHGQDSLDCMYPCKPESGFLVGIKSNGIGFGGFNKINGVNLSLVENTCKINGFSTSLFHNLESYKIQNGIDITLFSYTDVLRGVHFSLLGEVDSAHGLSAFGLFGTSRNVNGLQLTGLVQMNMGKTCGVNITGLYQISEIHKGISLSPGFTIIDSIAEGIFMSGIYLSSETANGLTISMFNRSQQSKGLQVGIINSSKNHKGIQFGLININKANRPIFRYLPIINFNFKKKKPNNGYKT